MKSINPIRWLSAVIMSSSRRDIVTTVNHSDKGTGTVWLGPRQHPDAVSLPGTDESCRVCFRNLTDETLILCWINEDGRPHHFYALTPHRTFLRRNALWCGSSLDDIQVGVHDHIETTRYGHTFSVAIANDDDVETMRKQKSLSHATMVGSYRPEKRPELVNAKEQRNNDIDEDDFKIHLVEIIDTSKVSPTSPVDRLKNLFTFCMPITSKRKLHDMYNDDSDGDDDNDLSFHYSLRVRLVTVDDKPFDTTKKRYIPTVLGKCRWPVRVEPNWYGRDKKLEHDIAYDLDRMAQCLPPHALRLLRDEQPTPIWINRTLQAGSRQCPKQMRHMCFHPGNVEWLIQHGMHPEKVNCVELYRASDYRQTRTDWGTGGLLLHEFSHAYHHKAYGYDYAEIVDCYNQAMADGLYEWVRVHGLQGPMARAYACTNAMEYFAELSTAFLGGISQQRSNNSEQNDEEFNKWYPFCRRQIREHDPRAYALLKKIWKVEDENTNDSQHN